MACLLAPACRGGGAPPEPPGAAAAERPVTVATAHVAIADVPIELDGIGSVAPYMGVLVRAQVDGRLDAVEFVEGADVSRGQVLARLDARPLQAARDTAAAALLRDRATAHHDAQVAARTRALRGDNLVPQQQLDDADELAAQSAAAVALSQAQLDAAELQLAYTRIVAPLSGRAGVRLVDPGNIVHAGDANGLVVINQVDPIAVMVTLPADALPALAAAQARGKLPAIALARDNAAALGHGEVAAIDNAINPNTATIRLKAVFANAESRLWPSQFVRVRLQVDTLRGVRVLPAAAVQRGPAGPQVFVVGSERKVRAVAAGGVRMLGERAVLGAGVATEIAAGAEVVIDGQHLLKNGSRIAATATPPGSAPAEP